MSPKPSLTKPKRSSFVLTRERDLPRHYRIARTAIFIYLLMALLVSSLMCDCLGLPVIMCFSAVVALIFGSRLQRIVSVGLLTFALFVLWAEMRNIRLMRETVRLVRERSAAPQPSGSSSSPDSR